MSYPRTPAGARVPALARNSGINLLQETWVRRHEGPFYETYDTVRGARILDDMRRGVRRERLSQLRPLPQAIMYVPVHGPRESRSVPSREFLELRAEDERQLELGERHRHLQTLHAQIAWEHHHIGANSPLPYGPAQEQERQRIQVQRGLRAGTLPAFNFVGRAGETHFAAPVPQRPQRSGQNVSLFPDEPRSTAALLTTRGRQPVVRPGRAGHPASIRHDTALRSNIGRRR